ncbi:MAG: sodium/solute symporter [Acidobacteria bacterium]|nr:sodium/solute symporter [Acidobacteriota bacterium]
MTALDAIVIVAYLLLIGYIGSRSFQRGTTARDYFLGGRGMSWLPVGISIVAADMSAITIMGTPAWAFGHNYEMLWTAAGYPFAAVVALKVFVPFYARLNLFTAYEYLERRFDLRVRTLASLLFLSLRGAHVSIVVYAPSLVLQIITGLPAWKCVLFMGVFTTIYTTLGGMKGVIWTDVVQFTAMTTGVILLLAVALSRIPGGVVEAWRVAEAAGRLKAINLSFDPRELNSLWASIIGGMVLTLSPLATDQVILQRLFTTKSVRDCRQSVLTQSVLITPISVILFALGTVLFAFYHFHPERLAGLASNDAVVPFFAVHELRPGLAGLIVAAILSASMAVMSAGINSLATATSVDFYQRLFNRAADERRLAAVGRMSAAAWGVVVTVLALFAGRLGALAIAYNKISSIVSGPLLGVFLLATLNRRTGASAALVGAGVGATTSAWMLWRLDWSFFWFGPIGCVVTVLCGSAAGFWMRPPELRQIQGLVIGCGEPEDAKTCL